MVSVDVVEEAIDGVLGADEGVLVADEVVAGSVDDVVIEDGCLWCRCDASGGGRGWWCDYAVLCGGEGGCLEHSLSVEVAGEEGADDDCLKFDHCGRFRLIILDIIILPLFNRLNWILF